MAARHQPAFSAVELSARLRAGEESVGELAERLFERLAEDPHRAWAALDREDLLAQARALDALDAQSRRGMPLFGVPVAIKDAFDTVGLPTAYGSSIYAGHRPARDADAVTRLRSAGALVAGKASCAELSWMTPPRTLNPLDPARTPGGSSSGSAAAVAAGEVPLAIGAQTAGSVIRPGSYCGVLGFKPTFGAFPRAGAMPLSATLDTVGVFARSVEDIRLVSEVLWSVDPREPTIRSAVPLARELEPTAATQPRIAFARIPFWERIEAQAQAAIEDAITRMREGGAELVEVELDESFVQLTEAQRTIQWVESAAALAGELRRHPDALSPQLREALREGAEIGVARYEAALARGASAAGRLLELLGGLDGLLLASALDVPPLGLEFTGDPLLCRALTLAGAPCISLPLAWTPAGLPAGLQLAGAPRSDRGLLRAAGWLLERGSPSPSTMSPRRIHALPERR